MNLLNQYFLPFTFFTLHFFSLEKALGAAKEEFRNAQKSHAPIASTLVAGSCMSSFIAHFFNGGPSKSSTIGSIFYHRSDVLLPRLQRQLDLIPQEYVSTLSWKNGWKEAIEDQYSGFGKHGLKMQNPNVPGFLQAFEESGETQYPQVKFIFMDPYVDIRAKLWSHPDYQHGLFINPDWCTNPDELKTLLTLDKEYLSIDASIENYKQLILLFQKRWPEASIFMILWPNECFTQPRIIARNQEFRTRLSAVASDFGFRAHLIETKLKPDEVTSDSEHPTLEFYQQIAMDIQEIAKDHSDGF